MPQHEQAVCFAAKMGGHPDHLRQRHGVGRSARSSHCCGRHSLACCTPDGGTAAAAYAMVAKKSGFHAAMYLAKRWRAPEAATQPRNLLENYSGDRQSWSAQTFSNGSKHQQTKRPSTVAAFCLESPSLRTNSPWSLVLCRYGVPRAEGHPHEVPALRLPPPGQGKTTHMAAQSRRHRDHCSLQHCGARRLAIDVNAKC
jgi:hypothetical protein